MQLTWPPAVYLVEDNAPIRERLRDLLVRSGEARIVGEAGSPSQAIADIRARHPDVVVLDYQLDGGTGVDVMQGLRDDAPVFIVLTNHVDAHTRGACLSAGASYFLDKSTEFTRVRAILAQLRQPKRARTPERPTQET